MEALFLVEHILPRLYVALQFYLVVGRKEMEGGGDSNPVIQIENLSSCRLDDLPLIYTSCVRSLCKELGRTGSSLVSTKIRNSYPSTPITAACRKGAEE